MKKNKGFTLVELLAVIVILAIIMVISIPAVLNTMTSARRKTFGEYVTKVYDVALKKYLADELINGGSDYVRYDITKDLDLNNTGDYRGYVVIIKNGDSTDAYIGLSDNEYHTATQLSDNSASVVNYINYNLGGEPTYASPLVKYDGKSNSFTNGKVDDFGLPEKEDRNDLVTLKAESTPEQDFETLLKDFHNKAKKVFIDNRGKDNGIVLTQPLTVTKLDANHNKIGDETIGKIYYSAISYKSIYGESETNNGYVIIMQLSVDEGTDDFLDLLFSNYKMEYVALTNDDFHTSTYFANHKYDAATGKTTTENDYIPVIITYTYGDNNPYFEPKYTNHLELVDFSEVINDGSFYEKELELCNSYGYPNCQGYTPTEEYKKSLIQYVKESYKTKTPSFQKYVNKDFNDGLTKKAFDLEYIGTEGGPFFNISYYNS